MKNKILICAVIITLLACIFTACKSNKGNEGEVIDVVQERALYVRQYSDYDASYAWKKEYIDGKDVPPVSFKVDGKDSSQLKWTKEIGNTTVYTDFSEEAPSKRLCREITYTCKDEGLKVVLTETSYPGYAVCEYDARLYNIAKGKSGLITDMTTVDTEIKTGEEGAYFVHANRGSLCAFNDFEPLTYKLKDTVSLSVSNGKTTSEYIPYFNVEDKMNNTGTIAILNWQGNWKTLFTKQDSGVKMTAGQYETAFEMKKDESMRFPGLVLLFYKGDYTKGQNVYRRWIYECNLFRYEEKHMKNTNVLICPSSDTEAGDLREFEVYKKTGLTEYIDKFNKDAGWYEKEGLDWPYTGNWFVNEKAYPNGLKALSDAAHAEGLQFAVWFEPERIQKGTKTSEDLTGKLMTGSSVSDEVTSKGATLLLNYADPEVVDYVVETLDKVITESGIDQYRQDFNMFPGEYWKAWDEKEAGELGMERKGVTENHYTDGYLKVFDELVKRHPGLYIDACASGGMRYDLETMRYAFLHTRSDFWASIESAQCQTFGSSMWFLYWGTGFTDFTDYDVRSHIGNSIGVGASNEKEAEKLKNALIEWKYIADYLFYDYYPLTAYAGSGNNPMAIQYDSPENGKGMFMTYFRVKGETTVCPQGLAPDALYDIWNRDDKDATFKTLKGSEIMAGISISSKSKSAVMYEYALAEGQNTESFRKAEIKTGAGSTDYTEEEEKEEFIEEYPELTGASYKNGLTDEELEALYYIKEDDTVRFAAVDYRSTGVIYEISKNIYDELYLSSTQVKGWKQVMKTHLSIYIDSTKNGPFTFNTWDGGYFPQMPMVRNIGDAYFLWLANIIPFSDSDGGWQDWNVSLIWDKKSGGQGKAAVEGFTVDYTKNQKIFFVENDTYNYNGAIYSITEEMYNSFVYDGKCFVSGNTKWYELDNTKAGIYSCATKAPAESVDVSKVASMFEKWDISGVKAFAAHDETGYRLWIMNKNMISLNSSLNRVLFTWYSPDGEFYQQTMLL